MGEMFEAIQETSYLSAPSARQYRAIMRKMFVCHESMRYRLYREEILELLHQDPEYADVTDEQLRLDLDQLVAWGNLNAVQDPGAVRTIAEYNNRKFRYFMSDRAIEIERMTVRLENLYLESGNLSSNYFVRIENALSQIPSLKEASDVDVNQWWHELQDDFGRLNQNYKNYLREFYSADTITLLKSVEFLLHKDKFTVYLREFISQMQLHARKIQRMLRQYRDDLEGWLLEKTVDSELAIPHLNEKQVTREMLEQGIRSGYMSFLAWFIGENGRKAEYETILEITNDIIRTIIEKASLIADTSSYGISRKDDYRHYMKMFAECETLEDAHCLSAHVFGVSTLQHFHLLHMDESDALRMSMYEKEHDEIELTSSSRTFREKRSKTGYVDRTFEKQIQRQEYLRQVEEQTAYLMRFVKDHRLKISEIDEVIPSFARTVLLRWIGNANMTESRSGMTEFGNAYHLEKEEGTCVLHCEDGDLTMPMYVFTFES